MTTFAPFCKASQQNSAKTYQGPWRATHLGFNDPLVYDIQRRRTGENLSGLYTF
jgi:hypothetical protein